MDSRINNVVDTTPATQYITGTLIHFRGRSFAAAIR
jgi:hypothetical protein